MSAQLEHIIKLERQIGRFRDAVSHSVGQIDGVASLLITGHVTHEQAGARLKTITSELWSKKAQIFCEVIIQEGLK